METDSVSETLCFIVIFNRGRWIKSINPVIMSDMLQFVTSFDFAVYLIIWILFLLLCYIPIELGFCILFPFFIVWLV
jgi:hypothetical protein